MRRRKNEKMGEERAERRERDSRKMMEMERIPNLKKRIQIFFPFKWEKSESQRSFTHFHPPSLSLRISFFFQNKKEKESEKMNGTEGEKGSERERGWERERGKKEKCSIPWNSFLAAETLVTILATWPRTVASRNRPRTSSTMRNMYSPFVLGRGRSPIVVRARVDQ